MNQWGGHLMHGTIIGDIAGCMDKFNRNKRLDFQPIMHPEGNSTDGTTMTVTIRVHPTPTQLINMLLRHT